MESDYGRTQGGDAGMAALIVEHLPDLVFVYRVDSGELLFINATGLAVLGYTQEEANEAWRNGFVPAIVSPDDQAIGQRALQRANALALGEKSSQILRLRLISGQQKWFSFAFTPLRMDATKATPEEILTVGRDITEFVERGVASPAISKSTDNDHQQMRCSHCNKLLAFQDGVEQVYQVKCARCGLINTLHNGHQQIVCITDRHGKILYVNDEAEAVSPAQTTNISAS